MLRLRTGKVDFIDDGHDFKPIVDRQVHVRKRLRFYPLRGVHNEYGTFTCGKRAADFIRKVHMARRIDEIEHILLAVGMGIEHAHGGRFYGNAALALDIHGIE